MPNGPDKLEALQRDYTSAYKEKLDKYRHARILHSFLTGAGYILTANPYWNEALGYELDKLRFANIYMLVPNRDQVTRCLLQVMAHPVNDEVMYINDVTGQRRPIMAWFGMLVEKASGTWVCNFTAVLLDL